MVEGESGIMAKAPPWNRPHFEPSKLQLTWPNGAIAQMFSAEEPERLRGPQCDTFWADELCAWKKMQETWDMLMFGFRLGRNPQGCITTTPKPVPNCSKKIKADEKTGTTVVVKGSTYDNRGNLAKPFFDKVVKTTRERGSVDRSLRPISSTTCRGRCGSAPVLIGTAFLATFRRSCASSVSPMSTIRSRCRMPTVTFCWPRHGSHFRRGQPR
jgi:hypothetical protein